MYKKIQDRKRAAQEKISAMEEELNIAQEKITKRKEEEESVRMKSIKK